MAYCSSCGKEVSDSVNFCPDCGGNLNPNASLHDGGHIHRPRSAWWYLVPILFSIIGGIIAYFVMKDDDPPKAKNCLIIGIIVFTIGLITVPFGF